MAITVKMLDRVEDTHPYVIMDGTHPEVIFETRSFAKGEVVPLDDQRAEKLIALGVAEPV